MPKPDRYQHVPGLDKYGTGRHLHEANDSDVERLSHRKRLALVLRHYSEQLHDQGSFMGSDLIRHAAK